MRVVCDGHSPSCEPAAAHIESSSPESGLEPPISKGIPALAGLRGTVETLLPGKTSTSCRGFSQSLGRLFGRLPKPAALCSCAVRFGWWVFSSDENLTAVRFGSDYGCFPDRDG